VTVARQRAKSLHPHSSNMVENMILTGFRQVRPHLDGSRVPRKLHSRPASQSRSCSRIARSESLVFVAQAAADKLEIGSFPMGGCRRDRVCEPSDAAAASDKCIPRSAFVL
jgi:hypothetical protein